MGWSMKASTMASIASVQLCTKQTAEKEEEEEGGSKNGKGKSISKDKQQYHVVLCRHLEMNTSVFT
eukprot:m.48494 g.48494  ORF g.48494 m.48494 type:complete len:66 (+) comp11045_c0_seq1:1742-1939(+)